jgi:DNA-binding NtrC family response regulator
VGAAAAPTHVNVRIVTATNRDLREAAVAREFREDLYYRLNVYQIGIPPLRERADDIPLLLNHYLALFTEQHRRPPLTLAPVTLERLCLYRWPGNVRELRNIVERLVLRAVGGVIPAEALPPEIVGTGAAAVGAGPASDSHQDRVAAIVDRMLGQQEPFWTTVYPAFMARDITREDLRQIVRTGLERSQGSYRLLVGLFHMPPHDYKRFLAFLKQHDCHLPFQRFRALSVRSASSERRAIDNIA